MAGPIENIQHMRADYHKFGETEHDSLLRRGHGKLDQLTAEQHNQLCIWMRTVGLGYKQIGELITQNFDGMTCGMGTLVKFYRRYVAADRIEERMQHREVVDKVKKNIKEFPGVYSQVTLDAIDERATMLAMDPGCNPKHLKLYVDMGLRLRAMNLAHMNINYKLRALAIAERKEKRMEKTLEDPKLNNAERIENIRKIFQKEA